MAIGNIKLRAGDCEKIFIRWGHEECASLISCRDLVTKDPGLRGTLALVPTVRALMSQTAESKQRYTSLPWSVSRWARAPRWFRMSPDPSSNIKIFGWIIKGIFRELKIPNIKSFDPIVLGVLLLLVKFYFWDYIRSFLCCCCIKLIIASWLLSGAYQGVRKNRCVVYCGEELQQKRLWPHSEGIRSGLRPHQDSFPPLIAPITTQIIKSTQNNITRRRSWR